MANVSSARRPTVAAVVLTLNEEQNLADCLNSLRGWVDELFVVDSGSTDGTVRIATDFGATVVEHPFENYAAQRNWAMRSLPMTSDWELHIDADERVTPELATEATRRLGAAGPVSGFLVSRRTMFMGRWIRHGGHYPCYHLRLFRRGTARCEDKLYDQHFVADGPVDRLAGDLVDIVATNLTVWWSRHVRWARLEAIQLRDSHEGTRLAARLSGSAQERRRWARRNLYELGAPRFARAFGYFVYRYIFRRGFLDGIEGLIFHFLQGCCYRFLIDAYLLELERQGGGAK